jgi:hypothetical protein
VTLRQFQHLLAVELGHTGKVEIGQLLDQRETGFLDAPLAAVAATPFDLILNQRRQIGFIGPVGLGRSLRLGTVVLVQRRQLQL